MTYKFENLDYSKPLYALQEFTFNGKRYAKGDEFPWQRLATSKHKVAQMWNGRKIRHTLQGDAQLAPAATQLPKDPPPVKPLDTPTVTATLEHTGAGWFNVVVEGLGAVNDAKIKGREAALQWATENNYALAVDGA